VSTNRFGTSFGRAASHRPASAESLDFCSLDEEGRCVTCSDEALPARVIEFDPILSLATVEVNGRTIEVDVSLVDGVAPGQLLLVHGGVALGCLDEN
jgi:hypothetical protein